MHGERVLVVDDEPEIREMLREALEENGYQCSTATEYESALRMISSQPYDLLLLDVVMPRRSGMELFLKVKSSHPDIAVVFITATSDPKMAADALGSGACDYLVKPISLGEVEQAVARALRGRREGTFSSTPARVGG